MTLPDSPPRLGEPRQLPDQVDPEAQDRGLLLGVAYRMLGALTDAEDAVQEGYSRWYRLSTEQRAAIHSPRAWLVTAVSRVCLDMLGSARARRERYVGEWLPEPLPPAGWSSQGHVPFGDPEERVAIEDSVSMALLVVLETMTPAERVSFVLHDVFRFTFPEVAEILGRTAAACRQLAASARKRVRSSKVEPVNSDEHRALVRAFKQAWETGDMTSLIGVLDPRVTVVADGGGRVNAARNPIRGADQAAAHLLDVLRREPALAITERDVNGQPGIVTRDGEGGVLAVISFAASSSGLIGEIWAVRNPDKLRAWGAHGARPLPAE